MTMRLTKGLLNSFQLLLLNFTTYVRLLLPLRGVVIESINMKHVLKWRPLESPCNAAVSYYVQFQGDFERLLNNSWWEAPDCQSIDRPVCDLTFDLGSDSDYDVRVRVQCGRKVSAWSKLEIPFNRKNTLLTAPGMEVVALGDGLQVTFKDMPRTTKLTVTVWDHEQTPRASSQVLTVQESPLYLNHLQEGAVYCIEAQRHLLNRSSSPTTQCVSVAGRLWLKPTFVSIAVFSTAGLMIFIFWLVVHSDQQACKAYLHKEPLPSSLLLWPAPNLNICHVNVGHGEHTNTVLLLEPQTPIMWQSLEGPDPHSIA